MREAGAVVLAVALALSAAPGWTLAAVPQGQTGGVQGVAKDSAQQNLAGVRVQMRGANGQLSATGTTNAAGQFSFTGLAPGAYNIEVLDAAGNIVGIATVTITAGATATLTITAAAAGALKDRDRGGLTLFGLGTLGTVAVLGGAAAITTVAVVATHDGKILICHKQVGRNPQTIEVKESARDSHMAHGDTLGACPASPSR